MSLRPNNIDDHDASGGISPAVEDVLRENISGGDAPVEEFPYEEGQHHDMEIPFMESVADASISGGACCGATGGACCTGGECKGVTGGCACGGCDDCGGKSGGCCGASAVAGGIGGAIMGGVSYCLDTTNTMHMVIVGVLIVLLLFVLHIVFKKDKIHHQAEYQIPVIVLDENHKLAI